MAVQVGQKPEAQVPADWLWHGGRETGQRHPLAMPDTDTNRAAYPENTCEKPGLGFPILRMVVLLSLATGLLCDMAVRPYAGKETGENALLRTLWDAGAFRRHPAGQSSLLLVLPRGPGDGPSAVQAPEMVRKEIWMGWPAYNLTRRSIAQAAVLHSTLPRQIGFTGAVQAIAASWNRLSDAPASGVGKLALVQFEVIASHNVGDRPGRVEPRAVKHRVKPHRLLMKPRQEARDKFLAAHRKCR